MHTKNLLEKQLVLFIHILTMQQHIKLILYRSPRGQNSYLTQFRLEAIKNILMWIQFARFL